MSSIIEKLYHGDIHHDFWLDSKNPTYQKATRLKGKVYEKLLDTLNEEQKELFEKYIDATDELAEIVQYDIFTHAIKFSAVFMTEAFTPPIKTDDVY